MNVWWCAVSSGARCQHMQGRDGHDQCGLRRLVPVDALVLVRDAEGLWPVELRRQVKAIIEWASTTGQRSTENADGSMSYELVAVIAENIGTLILDALAEAAKDNPQ